MGGGWRLISKLLKDQQRIVLGCEGQALTGPKDSKELICGGYSNKSPDAEPN